MQIEHKANIQGRSWERWEVSKRSKQNPSTPLSTSKRQNIIILVLTIFDNDVTYRKCERSIIFLARPFYSHCPCINGVIKVRFLSSQNTKMLVKIHRIESRYWWGILNLCYRGFLLRRTPAWLLDIFVKTHNKHHYRFLCSHFLSFFPVLFHTE